jgi:cytochrome c biogenesis protein
VLDESRGAALQRIGTLLASHGWAAKMQQRENGVMVAARKGRSNKVGYLAAHSAIVLICIGGLLDGDLFVRLQMAALGKATFSGGGLISDVPDKHRMSVDNPAYRGNLFVPEGARAGTAVLNMPSGIVLQPLPFDVELKRFVVEYYATGMPKLFASEIVVHDHASGKKIEHKVEVNKPAFHDGIAIYQSSFEDGGSRVKLKALPLHGPAGGRPFEIEGRIGDKTDLVNNAPQGDRKLTLEFAALRVINVENLSNDGRGSGEGSGADVRKVDLVQTLDGHLGSGTKVQNKKELRNVGPSITYRLRDAAGQAREFHNYMAPVTIDGAGMFLAGVRDNAADSFRYLRIPADDQGQIDGWLRLRHALDDPAQREKAARRYARLASPDDKPEVTEQLVVTARRALGLFAGAEGAKPEASGAPVGGLQALSDFLESAVPEAERMRVSGVLIRILNGALFELLNLSREQAGLAPLQPAPDSERFMTLAVTSLSDSFFYPAPMIFQLSDFTQVQASVFQVARAPGKTLVYAGAVSLILGVFMMLYVRDRRLWVWLQDLPEDAGRTRVSTALSSTRRTLDGDAEFDRLRAALLKENTP